MSQAARSAVTRKEEKYRRQLAAMKKLAEVVQPYEYLSPALSVGEVLRLENESLAAEDASASGPRPEWKAEKIELQLMGGKTRVIEAEVFGALAVHRMLGCFRSVRPRYSLTHVASTKLVASELNYSEAKYLAERMAYLDWSLDSDGKPSRVTGEKGWIIFQASHVLGLYRKKREAAKKGKGAK